MPAPPVTASEPVFGYMAEALGLTMRNERFQLAIMNDTEPSARDVAAFEHDLKEHKVRVMFYNKQASDKIVQHLVALARAAKIPVVGVTETAPPGLTYQDWMLGELDDTEKALAGPIFMNVVELDHATSGSAAAPCWPTQLRDPRRRIHRRARPERRRQDHADARHSRAAAAERRDVARVRPRAAARRPRHRLPAAGAHRAAGFARARARFHRQLAARRALGPAVARAATTAA